jgi:hypothetical protein
MGRLFWHTIGYHPCVAMRDKASKIKKWLGLTSLAMFFQKVVDSKTISIV